MSGLSNKCVLLKGIPFHCQEDEVGEILHAVNFDKGVDKIKAHIRKQGSEEDCKSWIVLFRTEEDATACFNHGPWEATVGEETFRVITDFCSECIIPESWSSQQIAESWTIIQEDNFSSISSSDLFAGDSLPFQHPSPGKKGDGVMTETSVYKSNFDANESVTTSITAACKESPISFAPISSDSILFGSGRVKDFKMVGEDWKGSSDTNSGVSDSSKVKPKTDVRPLTQPNQRTDTMRDACQSSHTEGASLCNKTQDRCTQNTSDQTNEKTTAKLDVLKGTVEDVSSHGIKSFGSDQSEIHDYDKTISNSGLQSSASRSQKSESKMTAADEHQRHLFDQGIPQYYTGPVYGAPNPGMCNPGYGGMPLQPINVPIPALQYGYPGAYGPGGLPENKHMSYPYQYGFIATPYPPYHIPVPRPTTGPDERNYTFQSQFDDKGYLYPNSRNSDTSGVKLDGSNKQTTGSHLETTYLIPTSARPNAAEVTGIQTTGTVQGQPANSVSSMNIAGKDSKLPKSRANLADMPKLPQKRQTRETEKENPYHEIPADNLSRDHEESKERTFKPRYKILARKLPPTPSTDDNNTSTKDDSHSSMKGNRHSSANKSLTTDNTNSLLQPKEKTCSCIPGEMKGLHGEEIEKLEGNERPHEKETNKIVVTKFRETTSLESLCLFFENKRKSGGGEIKSTDHTDPDAVIIEFQDGSGVSSVLQKQETERFKLDGALLEVRPYFPPFVDKYRFFLRGLEGKVSRESLDVFLEVVTGLTPVAVDRGETPGTVMLTFEEPPDLGKFQQGLNKRTLEDRVLSVSQVEVSSCVSVTGYDCNESKDALTFYFENKRSGGGEVEWVKMEKHRTLIRFRNAEEAKRVCDGRKHFLGGKELSVCLYYKCMDLDENYEVQIPEKIVLPDIHRSIIRFIKSTRYQDILTVELKHVWGAPVWPSSDEKQLTIICTVDPKQKESIHLVKDWKTRCTEVVSKILDTLDCNEDIIVQQEAWKKSLEALSGFDVPSPDDVVVFTKQEEKRIVVCGERQAVADVSKKIQVCLETIEKEAVEETREITKTVILKVYQVALLNAIKFFDTIEIFDVVVNVTNGREISLSGKKRNIDSVLSTMHEKINGFFKTSFFANKLYKDMLFEKETRDYIKTKLMRQKVIGVWNVVKGDENVYMYSKTAKQAETATEVVKKCLVQNNIPLDLEMEDIIDGERGRQLLSKLVSRHKGLLKLEKSVGELLIISTDYLMEEVCGEVKQFLDLHMITEEFLDINSGTLCFINRFLRDRLDQIENQYKGLSVVVEQQETQYRNGFKIKGVKDGCKLAIKQLRQLAENICTDEHTVESGLVDVGGFFKTTLGRNELCDIELNEKCVLKIKGNRDVSKALSVENLLKPRAECEVNGCQIFVMEGDMTELHEEVDVLVIPRNIYMTNDEGVAGTIIQKGGYEIVKECEAFEKKHRLSYGDIFVGEPGKLHCKHILHVIAPEWRGGGLDEAKQLRTVVKNCLQKMAEKQLRSIAFPAICLGRFRFPTNEVFPNIVGPVLDFLTVKITQEEKRVYLCDTEEKAASGFVKELQRVFPNVKEKKTMETQSSLTVDSEKNRPIGDKSVSPGVPRRIYERKTEGGESDNKISVSVVKGELARQTVDVIVNSTNCNLDLRIGVISKSLLKSGGEVLMHDLARNYPDGIKVGNVAVSTGGNLQCKEIYHGVLMKWDQGDGAAERVMEVFVERCLAAADNNNMTSIAFPALGTGVLGFPADVVAQLMFKTIQEYEMTHPATGIRSALLVVYQEDRPTVHAFSSVEKMFNSGRHGSKQIDRKQLYSFADTYSMSLADVNKYHQFNVGPVVVKILQGDITKEKTDVVVNSALEDLDLTKGAVSKAILNAAGSSLQTECLSADNKERIKANGFLMTGSGNMMCGKILHVRARNRSSNWEESVTKCLKAVEDDGSSSVSFPALGTGGKGCNPESVAKAMFTGFRNYILSSEYRSTLKSINIVIFQAQMVNVFITASQGDSRSNWKIIEKLRQRPTTANFKVVFRIFADSTYRINRVKRLLDEIFVEDLLYPRKKIGDVLKAWQIDKIKRMADNKKLGINVDSRNGSIKLCGPKIFVKQVKDEIEAYLINIEKDVDAKNAAQAAAISAAKGTIPLPKSWGKMALTDGLQIVPLTPTDNDYIAVSARFQQEALGTFTNIVKIERVQNPTLYIQYMAKKKQMEQSNPSGSVEKQLWHGTKELAVDNINTKGFDRNYNSGASHGVGVYFAVKASTSVQGYCQPNSMGQKHIYFARVLTGDFCVGQGGSRLPPQKIASGNPMDRYDSTTDNMTAPNFFVIFHDAQAYPEFLITFQ